MPPPLTSLNNLFCSNLETKTLGDLANAIPDSGDSFIINFNGNQACIPTNSNLFNLNRLPAIVSSQRQDVKRLFSSPTTSNFSMNELGELLENPSISTWNLLKYTLPPQPPQQGSIVNINLCNVKLGNMTLSDIANIPDFFNLRDLNINTESTCQTVNNNLTSLTRLQSILSVTGVSIADVKATFETSALKMSDLNKILVDNPSINTWDALKLKLQMPDQSASLTSTIYPQQNRARVQQILNVLYTNYLFDNKEIVRFLSNVDNIDSGNVFEQITKKIMSLKVPYYDTPNDKYLFLKDNGDVRITQLDNYKKTLYPIIVLAEVLKNIIETNTGDYKDKYAKIDKVEFLLSNITGGTSISNSSIDYLIESNSTLKIYVSSGDYRNYIESLNYDKYSYRYNSAEGIDRGLAAKNLIHFMMKFEPYNMLSQLYVFYFILKIIEEYLKFYEKAETVIQGRNINSSNCTEYFNNQGQFKIYQNNFNNLESNIDSKITGDTYQTVISTAFYVSQTCPMSIRPSADMWINASIDLKNDYVIVHNNIEYTIQDANYTNPTSSQVDKQGQKMVSNMIVNAKANNANGPESDSCSKYTAITSITGIPDIMNPSSTSTSYQFSFRLKTADNLKSDYGNISGELEDLNEQIAKSRDKINKQVKSYTARQDIIKSLDLRQNIYYVVFGIIGVIILVLLLVDTKQSIKVYSGFFIALVLLTMNIINYYMKYDYIEHFITSYTVPEGTGQELACNSINISTLQSERIRFINQHIPTFTTNVYEVLEKVKLYAGSANTKDIFKKISASLKEEKHTFEKHAETYKYKEDANKKSIENMKHEMISKSGFINLLSISSFVIVLIYVLYVIAPSYINIYLTVGIILILINMAIYFLVILHPVRTKARNKYWSKPSKGTIQSMS